MGTRSQIVNWVAAAGDNALSKFEAMVASAIKTQLKNGIQTGLLTTTPTSASTQGSGTAGATDWNINVAAGVVTVNGVTKEFAAQADFECHASTCLLQNGQSVRAAIVCKNVTGTVTMVIVKGAAATTGAQVAPTDAEIQAAVGAGNHWVKVAEILINRTGDTTVTQSQDNTYRAIFGDSTGDGAYWTNLDTE